VSLSSIPFIFQFLPVFLFLYYVVPKKWWRQSILLLGSLFFYTWIDPNHILVLISSILLNYLLGLVISKLIAEKKSTIAHYISTVGILINLGYLFVYKYSSFFFVNIPPFLGKLSEINQFILPLGISYFTFNSISYLVDIDQGIIKFESNILRFSNFLLMFPKVMFGPITGFSQIKDSLTNKWFYNDEFLHGLRRFISGLGKKVILADNLFVIVNKALNADFNQMDPAVAWFGLIAYSLQIFFDFSGYTDMAIGLGLMLGYRLPENFNFPYIAKNIMDFWRRWHMTLTGWFRTYLFIPLELKRKNAGVLRQPINILIVFIVTGLWHGASLNFVIWGAYYGVLLALESIGFGKVIKKTPAFFQHLYTLLLVMVGWIFFSINNIGKWDDFFRALLGLNNPSGEITLRSINILLFTPLIIVGIMFATPIFQKLESRLLRFGVYGRIVVFLVSLGIFILSINYLLANGYNSFIYGQF
jgi:alginate O-acetyltransferase complex protein AlgI